MNDLRVLSTSPFLKCNNIPKITRQLYMSQLSNQLRSVTNDFCDGRELTISGQSTKLISGGSASRIMNFARFEHSTVDK